MFNHSNRTLGTTYTCTLLSIREHTALTFACRPQTRFTCKCTYSWSTLSCHSIVIYIAEVFPLHLRLHEEGIRFTCRHLYLISFCLFRKWISNTIIALHALRNTALHDTYIRQRVCSIKINYMHIIWPTHSFLQPKFPSQTKLTALQPIHYSVRNVNM